MGVLRKRHLVSACLVAGICIFAANWLQPKFLYFQRHYQTSERDEVKKRMKQMGYEINTLIYSTDQSKQQSFLVYPSEILGSLSSVSLIALMGGNGMTAFDWLDWIVDIRPHLMQYPKVAFVLVDYPGYGFNDGDPSPNSMHSAVTQSVSRGIEVLRALGMSVSEVNVVGHSIGAAVASRWVSANLSVPPIARLVLSAPFTSITEMVPVIFPFIPGAIASVISRHNWDNRLALASITSASNVGAVYVVHGEQDEIVPFGMGKELSEIGNGAVTFVPLKHATHNDILSIVKLYGLLLSAPIKEASKL